MRIYFLCIGFLFLSQQVRTQNKGRIPLINKLELNQVTKGTIAKYWLEFMNNGMGQTISIPIVIAKGKEEGPVLGLVAAIHGNELNGIPVIQQVFKELDLEQLKGTIIGVPGVNVVSIDRDRRRFVDEEDLNRNFPGKEFGNRSQQYVWKIANQILPHFDYLVDMHTASFGRVNSLYVRADLDNDTIAQMATWQDCDIILNSKGMPSAGSGLAMLRTFRAEAMLRGIPTITVEYGNPQVYQSDIIAKGVNGIKRLTNGLMMTNFKEITEVVPPFKCRKSYWIYMQEGGLLTVQVNLKDRVKKGELIAKVYNPFGDLVRAYFAPEDGIVIGKSTNPVNMDGGRIIHLGILEE